MSKETPNDRDLTAQRALWGGLRRFTEHLAAGLTEIPEQIDADFFALASVVFEDHDEWCWAVSVSSGGTQGGIESTREAAQAAAQDAVTLR
jgi:hypothetical protein